MVRQWLQGGISEDKIVNKKAPEMTTIFGGCPDVRALVKHVAASLSSSSPGPSTSSVTSTSQPPASVQASLPPALKLPPLPAPKASLPLPKPLTGGAYTALSHFTTNVTPRGPPAIYRSCAEVPQDLANNDNYDNEIQNLPVRVIVHSDEALAMFRQIQRNQLNNVFYFALVRELSKWRKGKKEALFSPIRVVEEVQREQRKLFNKEFVYKILPQEVEMEFDVSRLMQGKLSSVNVEVERGRGRCVKHDKTAMRRFLRFLFWQPYAEAKRDHNVELMKQAKLSLIPDIDLEVLRTTLIEMTKTMIGVEHLAERMGQDMTQFTQIGCKRPRGTYTKRFSLNW